MIRKLLYIKNCGRFMNYTPDPSFYWNGQFSRNNVIYAENGSGKTTFTQIIKSLLGIDNNLLDKRKSLKSNDTIDISLMHENNQLNYKRGRWNRKTNNIEVFDTYYAENNVYLISLGTYEQPSDFYDLVMSQSQKRILNDIVSHKMGNKRLYRYKRNAKSQINKLTDQNIIKELEIRCQRANIRREQICKEIPLLEKKLSRLIEECGAKYLERVNYYLCKFNPSLCLTKLNKKGNNLVYHIEVDGVSLRSDSTSVSLKHTLSEGDKSSLSLSFFLARLDLLPDLDKRIIVFDDPISSFDTRRRNMTSQILAKIAKNAHQFFLLSHDLHFAKDFSDRIEISSITNLKIIWYNNSSVFVKHDINLETMTGISKDIYTLQLYLDRGAITDFEKRDVIRCIRPIIEGVFRLKYFSLFNDNQWLGDFLSAIKKSNSDSPLYRLNNQYDTLSEINDYCKEYHHSNPKYMETQIFDEELRQYVQTTLSTLAYI